MKKTVIILVGIVVLFLYGCSSETNDHYSTYNKNDIDPYDAMEIVTNTYTFEEIAEHYDERIILEYAYEELGVANVSLFIEELEDNEMYDEIEALFLMIDRVGYYPSAIYGEFCRDNRNFLIHFTDSDCVSEIPFKNRRSVTSMNVYDLDMQTGGGDIFLEGHSLCSLCFLE